MYFIQFSMTQDERKGLILCLKIEFSDGLGGVLSPVIVGYNYAGAGWDGVGSSASPAGN